MKYLAILAALAVIICVFAWAAILRLLLHRLLMG